MKNKMKNDIIKKVLDTKIGLLPESEQQPVLDNHFKAIKENIDKEYDQLDEQISILDKIYKNITRLDNINKEVNKEDNEDNKDVNNKDNKEVNKEDNKDKRRFLNKDGERFFLFCECLKDLDSLLKNMVYLASGMDSNGKEKKGALNNNVFNNIITDDIYSEIQDVLRKELKPVVEQANKFFKIEGNKVNLFIETKEKKQELNQFFKDIIEDFDSQLNRLKEITNLVIPIVEAFSEQRKASEKLLPEIKGLLEQITKNSTMREFTAFAMEEDFYKRLVNKTDINKDIDIGSVVKFCNVDGKLVHQINPRTKTCIVVGVNREDKDNPIFHTITLNSDGSNPDTRIADPINNKALGLRKVTDKERYHALIGKAYGYNISEDENFFHTQESSYLGQGLLSIPRSKCTSIEKRIDLNTLVMGDIIKILTKSFKNNNADFLSKEEILKNLTDKYREMIKRKYNNHVEIAKHAENMKEKFMKEKNMKEKKNIARNMIGNAISEQVSKYKENDINEIQKQEGIDGLVDFINDNPDKGKGKKKKKKNKNKKKNNESDINKEELNKEEDKNKENNI